MEGYLTLKEAAAKYGYSDAATLRQAIRRGVLAGEKVGTTWLVREEDITKYTEGQLERGRPRAPQRSLSAQYPPSAGAGGA